MGLPVRDEGRSAMGSSGPPTGPQRQARQTEMSGIPEGTTMGRAEALADQASLCTNGPRCVSG
ncbi:hypothetical protein SAMN05660662_0851 [Blastococcus aurantiacus]|uniref:Uncharacterized protein n=1 Tax=Blastococcus aurantiacus TaxID=1550231 RepID=A0A1G7HW62_9ACTN|nr:hypothetical protein SAMN05660662_0851 [Blastococcus aurantiacus]